MRVSARMMLALCVAVWAFMGALLALRHWQSDNIQSMLRYRSDSFSRMSDKIIDLVGNPVQVQCADYSAWTEMVDFVKTGDPQWAVENLVPSLKTFDTDALWVYGPDGVLVYSATGLADKGGAGKLPFKGQAERLFSKSHFAHFFFSTPAGPMEVRGATIHPSEDSGRKTPAAGYYFVGQLWDRAHLEKLSGLLDGTAMIMQVRDAAATRQGTVLEKGALVFHRPLNAWNGTPLAVMEVRTFSPIMARFVSNLDWALAVAGIFSLGILAVFSAALVRWVTIPLRTLSAALADGDPAPLANLEGGRSEFGNIARMVVRHFAQSRALVREMAERIRFEEAQEFLIRCGNTPGEGDFFQSLAKYLAGALETDFVCIDRLLPDGVTAQTIAVYSNGDFDDNMTYSLTDTPCGDSVGKTICFFPRNVRELFPNNEVLHKLEAESYAGATLWSSDGRPIGLIAVISRKPMADARRTEAILKLVAVRAAGELERRQAEEVLRISEANLSSLLDAIHESVFLIDREGILLVANGTFAVRLGRSVEQCLGKSVYSLVPADVAQRRREIIETVQRTGQPATFEDMRDGVWMENSVFPVFNPDHTVDRVVIYAADVTARKQAGEMLRESERFSRQVQKIARVGGWKANPHTDDLEWTEGVYDIIEERRDYAPGLTEGLKYYQPEYIPLLKQSMADCLLTGAPFTVECEVITVTGRRLWAEVRGLAPVTEGTRSYVMGTFQDITERKRAEEALRENQEWLALAQSAGRVGIFEWNMVTKETRWSDELKNILGLSQDGAEISYDIWARRTHPEDLARIEATVAERVQSGQDEMQFEFRFFRDDGGQRWIEVRGRILRDSAGNALRVVGTNLDITGRKVAEEEWKASQARYQSLFESAKDGIIILDAVSGRIVDANPSAVALIGGSRAELAGGDFWEIGAFKNVASSRGAFERLADGDSVHYEDVSLIGTGGAEVPVEFVATRYRVGNDRVVQCNIRDISERKRLEDQLRQSQKMDAIGQLAGGVAHDFNNLLQVILGNVGLIQRMQPPGAPTWDEVEEVRHAAESAAELTQQLLAFSRRQTIQPANCDLNQLIDGVLKMLRRLIGEHIELCFIPGEALERVRVDRGQIEQALMNLSVNARDAMPGGGKLTIRTENAVMDAAFCRENPWAVEGSYALITVTDTGRGMDAATRARIFEPFFSTKEVGQGTGLGLATVYGIVKQHNGLVHVDSVPNRGTVFSVYLPADETPEEAGQSPAKQPIRGGQETILVAEDEPSVLNLIAATLRTAGYSVLTACDGNDAVRVFGECGGAVDLAVLDVVMPGISGRETMERIKAMNTRTRFLFSSGYSPSSIHKDFIVEEGLHLIRKPYRREDLLAMVRRILDLRDAEGACESPDKHA